MKIKITITIVYSWKNLVVNYPPKSFCIKYKCFFFSEDVGIEKVLVSKFLLMKKSYKYIIGYLYNEYRVKPLHIMLPKTIAYVKSYDGQTIV